MEFVVCVLLLFKEFSKLLSSLLRSLFVSMCAIFPLNELYLK